MNVNTIFHLILFSVEFFILFHKNLISFQFVYRYFKYSTKSLQNVHISNAFRKIGFFQIHWWVFSMILLNNAGEKRTKFPIVNNSVWQTLYDWLTTNRLFVPTPLHSHIFLFVDIFFSFFLSFVNITNVLLVKAFQCWKYENTKSFNESLCIDYWLYVMHTNVSQCFLAVLMKIFNCVIVTKSNGYDYINTSLSEVEPLE